MFEIRVNHERKEKLHLIIPPDIYVPTVYQTLPSHEKINKRPCPPGTYLN